MQKLLATHKKRRKKKNKAYLSVDDKPEGVYKYFVLFSHEICHQKFSDRNAGSLDEEIENCA